MEYHVKIDGNDHNYGSASAAFKIVSKAAQVSQPSDIITVHESIYCEWVNPARRGTEDKRIIYQAAPGENVTITGSEIIKDWVNVGGTVWKTVIPNSLFGSYNPYKEIIFGDWLFTQDKVFYTGEVYLTRISYSRVILKLLQSSFSLAPKSGKKPRRQRAYGQTHNFAEVMSQLFIYILINENN